MVVFPEAAELPGEREATYGPTQEEHGTSCLRVDDGMFGSLNNQLDRNRTQMSSFPISEC